MARKKPSKPKTPVHKEVDGECIIPGAMPLEKLRGFVVNDDETQARVRSYVERETHGEKVIHAEKVATEFVMGVEITAWDVRTNKERYWVITNPTNLYSQDLFPSLDYTISFHVGVTTRVIQRDMVTVEHGIHGTIDEVFARAAQARNVAYHAKNPVECQAVGMQCRETLLHLVKELSDRSMVPAGTEEPQQGNFMAWADIIATYAAPGSSYERLRSYLKGTAKETWQLANWLTHSPNGDFLIAFITCDATETLAQAFLLSLTRIEAAKLHAEEAKTKKPTKERRKG
jgi:hypothetical protein